MLKASLKKATNRVAEWLLSGSDGVVDTIIVLFALLLFGMGVFYGIGPGKATSENPLADYLTFALPCFAGVVGGAGLYMSFFGGFRVGVGNVSPGEIRTAWCFSAALIALALAFLAYIAGHAHGGWAWLVFLGLFALFASVILLYRVHKDWVRSTPAALVAWVTLACAGIALVGEMVTKP